MCRSWQDSAMATAPKRKRLLDAYRFAGFEPRDDIRGIFGDPLARVIPLVRRSKKQSARNAGGCIRAGTTERCERRATCRAPTPGFTWSSRYGASAVRATAK